MARRGNHDAVDERRRRNMKLKIFIAALAAFVTLVSSAVLAQSYPNRPVRVIVPFPPASGTDVIARRIAEKLQQLLKQPFVIENKAGANGIIAAQAAAAAEPDGYTIFISTISTQATNVSLYKTLPYDPQKDFASISGIITNALILTARADFPADDVAGVIKVGKASPEPLKFGSGNTSSIVGNATFKSLTGVDVLEVAYKGTPQVLTDLMAGRLDLYFVEGAGALPSIHGGRIKALAVAGPRLAALPKVPSMEEVGLPSLRIVTWVAAFAPAKTPQPIIDKLNAAIVQVLKDKDEVTYLESIGARPFPTTPDELTAFVAKETAFWGEQIRKVGIEKQ
jgi:tripartite-type tricarboxylate transporter receptor subunit TctC